MFNVELYIIKLLPLVLNLILFFYNLWAVVTNNDVYFGS